MPSDDGPKLSIKLLGPMDVSWGGIPLRIGRQRQPYEVLALLALSYRMGPILRSEIEGTMWPDRETAPANLANALSVLHAELAAVGAHDLILNGKLKNGKGTLRLNPLRFTLDIKDFDRAVTNGSDEYLKQAVSLCAGQLLHGWTKDWVDTARENFELKYRTALQILCERLCAKGNFIQASQYAAKCIDAFPSSAEAHLLRMHALSDLGDSDGLRTAYGSARRKLRKYPDRLKAVSDQYPRLRQRIRHRMPSPLPIETAEQSKDLVGRDLGSVVQRFGKNRRMVTLTGPAGVGKTCLSKAVGERMQPQFTDGIYFVDLSEVTDESRVANAIAGAISPGGEEGQIISEATLSEIIGGRSLLLILDNCEQVAEACAAIAVTLLAPDSNCPKLHILATSRRPLDAPCEAEYQVTTLEVPPSISPQEINDAQQLLEYSSVKLFLMRARERVPTFELNMETMAAVSEICRSLDGIPLALEIAAAWLGSLTVAEIVRRLQDQILSQQNFGPDVSIHHQTLSAALDVSWQLLTRQEQTLMEVLSVFRGGWSLESAESIYSQIDLGDDGADTWEIQQMLDRLVTFSLVKKTETHPGSARYTYLNVVVLYAERALRQSRRSDAVRAAHRKHFNAFLSAVAPESRGKRQGTALSQLDAEYENLRTAMAWRHDLTSLRMAVALSDYWVFRSHFTQGRDLLRDILNWTECEGRTADRAAALKSIASLEYYMGEFEEALSHYEECKSIYDEIGDPNSAAVALLNIGIMRNEKADYAGALDDYHQALKTFRDENDKRAIANTLNNIGKVLTAQGMYSEAFIALNEALTLRLDDGEYWGIGYAYGNLGELYHLLGDYAKAEQVIEKSFASFQAGKIVDGVAYCHLYMAYLANEQCNRGKFSRHLTKCLRAFTKSQNRPGLVEAVTVAADFALRQHNEKLSVLLWSAAKIQRDQFGYQLSPIMIKNYKTHVGKARSLLGDDAFESLWQSGSSLSLADAVSRALTVH